MKTTLIVLGFFLVTIKGNAQDGFSCIATTRGNFEKIAAKKFDKIDINDKQTNIFSFSFPDKMFVHTVDLDRGTVSQFYKITEINEIHDNAYVITVKSGASGSEYVYYLTYYDKEIDLYQITSVDEKDRMDGVKYGDIVELEIIPYNQN